MTSSLLFNRLIKIAVITAITVAVIVALFVLPTKRYIVSLLIWIETLGVWGPVFLSIFYVAGTILFLPGSILTMGAGALFGVWKGFLAAWVGATLGACAAFLLGRTLARDRVDRKVSQNPRFSAIEKAVSRQGFKIVLLLRLSPIFPFNLLNYALGLTSVRFSKYAIASLVGMAPGGFMYVYIGATAGSLAAITAGEAKGGIEAQILKWIGLAVTIVVTVIVTRIARKSLKAVEESSEVRSEAPEVGPDVESDNPSSGQ